MNIRLIPSGWWKLDVAGAVITDGIDTMTWEPGLGYIMD